MSPIQLVLESVLALMLAACLFFFWRLDRKLAALRNGQDGIRAAAAELGQATAQAEAAVKAMRMTALEAGRDLQARINDARATADRLGLGAGRVRSSSDLTARSRL
jgi:cell division protein FtsB